MMICLINWEGPHYFDSLMTMLSIIILTYNTKYRTDRCIESLQKVFKKELENGYLEIIVIDNHSTDGTIKMLKKWQEKRRNILYISNKSNYGFAKGVNIGGKIAKGKYLLFLNSDTEVHDNKFLEMSDFLEKNKKVGVIGAKLQNEDGSTQKTTGVFYNYFTIFFMLIGFERTEFIRKRQKEIAIVDWVSGGAMMVRRELFEKLHGFDENFFMYMEDMEFCRRVKNSNNLVVYFPHIKIIHRQHGSSNRSFAVEQIYKGLLYYFKKDGNVLSYLFVRFMLCSKAIVLIAIGFLTRSKYLQKTYTPRLLFLR